MKNRKMLLPVLPIITLILEVLPYGAVLNFANPDSEPIRKTFSYFSLVPFGYANFSPFITAIITVFAFLSIVVYLITKKDVVLKGTKGLLAVGTALSLCPLMFGFDSFTPVAALISVTLAAELAFIIKNLKNK